jgi:hypothetical protein
MPQFQLRIGLPKPNAEEPLWVAQKFYVNVIFDKLFLQKLYLSIDMT